MAPMLLRLLPHHCSFRTSAPAHISPGHRWGLLRGLPRACRSRTGFCCSHPICRCLLPSVTPEKSLIRPLSQVEVTRAKVQKAASWASLVWKECATSAGDTRSNPDLGRSTPWYQAPAPPLMSLCSGNASCRPHRLGQMLHKKGARQ